MEINRLAKLMFAAIATVSIASSAQTESTQTQDSVVAVVADAAGLQYVPYEQLPLFGTFWETRNTVPCVLAPMPCPPLDPGLPIYAIADGQFLVDETTGPLLESQWKLSTADYSLLVQEQVNELANFIAWIQEEQALKESNLMMTTMDAGGPLSLGEGGGSSGAQFNPVNYGTNLWLEIFPMGTNAFNDDPGAVTLILHNTEPYEEYEIVSREVLSDLSWHPEFVILGSTTTNWTAFTVTMGSRTNALFFSARWLLDSMDVGIPDWWQQKYFDTVGIDADADPDADGESNFQEFLAGTNPTDFDTPMPPDEFMAILAANGTNVLLSWKTSLGALQNYSLGRYTFNWNTWNWDFTSLGQVSSNITSFQDVGAVTTNTYWDSYYEIEANYASGSTPTATTWISASPPAPQWFSVSFNPITGVAALSWEPSPGPVTGYAVLRKDNAASSFSTIATVAGNQTTYYDYSVPSNDGVEYQVAANYSWGSSPPSVARNPRAEPNYTTPASIVRGPQGRIYLAVSAVPQGVTSLRVYRTDTQQSYYPLSSFSDWWGDTYSLYTWLEPQLFSPGSVNGYFDVPITAFTNGIYQLTATQVPTYGTYQFQIQARAANGKFGDKVSPGYVTGDLGRPDYIIPFFDGRAQIAQNINFLFRTVVLTNFPFNIDPTCWPFYQYSYSGHGDYVRAGFHFCNNINSSPLTLNEFQPFEENNYYLNFCFESSNVDTNGWLNTGVGLPLCSGFDAQGNAIWYYFTTTENPPTAYFFDTPGLVSGASNPPLTPGLTSAASQWIVGMSPANWHETTTSNYTLTAENNIYGLSRISARWPGYNSPPQFPIAYPGAYLQNLHLLPGDWFFETVQPTVSPSGYYFAQHYIDPLPGEPAFSVTNSTRPVFIASVGKPFSITAWAKQSLANGRSGVFAYPEQYFDKAFKADTNGNPTAIETGILSEYGEFFPIEPGRVVLTTKPDGMTGTTGQCAVVVLKVQVDRNHDGIMDLSFAGPDNTSEASPMVFWVNNDIDRWHNVDFMDREQDDLERIDGSVWTSQVGNSMADGPYDYAFRDITITLTPQIPCTRDLEDYARLWIPGLSSVLASMPTNYTAQLTLTGDGRIRIFRAVEPDGGTNYLFDAATGVAQASDSRSNYVGLLTSSSPIVLSGQTNTGEHFIFCGAGRGSAGVHLEILDGNQTVIADTAAYLDLKDIKEMYERWTVGDIGTKPPAQVASLATNDLPAGVPAFQYGAPETTNATYILHVHGWNMGQFEKDRYAETAFKRLYWQGYRGSFGSFRWPTKTGIVTFDRSEYQAWNSAPGLYRLLTNLNMTYPGKVYLTAHSMGNITAGEALRLAGTNIVVNTFVAMQAAISAHTYDPTTANRPMSFDSSTPDRHAAYWTNNAPCYFVAAQGAGRYINFFNANDWALNWWKSDQNLKPNPRNFYYFTAPEIYENHPPFGSNRTLTFPTNTYEIFSFITEGRAFALGAQVGVGGPFSTADQIDLGAAPFLFGDTHKGHSAEFRSSNVQRAVFWNAFLEATRLHP